MLLYLGAVVAVALVGGLYPALAAALAGFALLNWYFVPTFHQWTIVERDNIVALVVFLAVGAAVSAVVDLAARRTSDAARARAQAETLSTLAGSVLRGSRPLPALLDQVRETFQLTGVTLLERRPETPSRPDLQHDPAAWRVAAAVGDRPCLTPAQGDADVPVDDDLRLVLHGHPLAAADRRVIEAFAAQAAVALRQERLEERAAAVGPLAEVDRLRTALLRSVSHDLRTPLASAKAAVDSLRSDVEFSDDDRRELLDTAEDSLARLGRLVENLLDMSRLQAGALAMAPQLISLAEAVPRAVDDVGEAGRAVRIQIPDELPEINADPALLERALVNLLTNALRYSPPGEPPLITASEHRDRVEIHIVDRGPGVPVTDWDRIFLPFQRLGDRDNATGVGLGLALSRGLIEAMGGTVTPEATPGGGLTMTVGLPVAERTAAGPDQAADPVILDRIDRWGTSPPGDPNGRSASAAFRSEPTSGEGTP
jgi:two-component system sensor histidine kinase KdpD